MRYITHLQFFDMHVQFLANQHWCLISNGFRLSTEISTLSLLFIIYLFFFFISCSTSSILDNKISQLLFKIIYAYRYSPHWKIRNIVNEEQMYKKIVCENNIGMYSPRQYIIFDTSRDLLDRSSHCTGACVVLSVLFPEQRIPRNYKRPS